MCVFIFVCLFCWGGGSLGGEGEGGEGGEEGEEGGGGWGLDSGNFDCATLFTGFLSHTPEQRIVLKKLSSGLDNQYIRENSSAGKLKTTRYNTAKLIQPKPDMTAPVYREMRHVKKL